MSRFRTKDNSGINEQSAEGSVQKALLEALGTPILQSSLQPILFDEFDEGTASFACHQWVADYVESVAHNDVAEQLIAMRERFIHVLESSDLLPQCGNDERLQLEGRLSNLIEQIGYYVSAVQTLAQGEGDAYVEDILEKLRISGYVYHPRKRLSTLLCLFIVSTDLMDTHFRELLEVLRSHEIALWARHPFGLLWVKILSHYIQHIYREVDRLATDAATQQTVVLTLETLERIRERLSTDAGLIDRRFNHALLLRLCSQMHVREPERLLDRAIKHLIVGSLTPLHTGSLLYNDADYIANIIENNEEREREDDANLPVGRFYTDRMELRIDSHSISIAELGVTSTCQLVPARLTLWHDINVSLGDKLPKDLRGKNDDSISYYKRLWRHAEEVLSTARKVLPQAQQPSRLDVGDGTEIIVCGKVAGSEHIFECRIVEDGYEGIGTLNVQGDVVGYYPFGVTLSTFWHQGKPLILEAYVKAVQTDGTYEFAMIENIREDTEKWCNDNPDPNTRLLCLVSNRSAHAQRAPGISSEGFSMSIGVPEGGDISDLHSGMVVEVGDIAHGFNGYLQGTFIREISERRFSIADALHKLLLWYAEGRVFTTDTDVEGGTTQESSPVLEQDVIERPHVEELLAIIDAKATIEEDYKLSYHYLAFCRLLTILLGLKERKLYYDSRLSLLEQLDYFANNGQVDAVLIRDLAQRYDLLLQRNPVLRHDMDRLQIISCLNSDESADAEKLFRWSGSQSEPCQQQLAALVLSYNYVRKAGLLPLSEEIRGRIYDLLRLSRDEKTQKKHYGREDYQTEFKTSAVYPPNAMVPDLPKQIHNILRVICGFLNAEGGKLYIGVNDQGYETGIDEDLKYRDFHGNPSTYQAYIENSIVSKMSQEAGHHTKTYFEQSERVLIVEVTPCPNPIMLGGNYYERMGTSTRQVNNEYLQTFLEGRRIWAEQHKPVAEVPIVPTTSDTSVKSRPPKAPINIIATSSYRQNVLHDYEIGFEPIVAIVCLMDSGKYKVIDEDDWQDALLKLAIHEREHDGWLVIVYADGHVAKVPVDELLDRERGRVYSRWQITEALFACIATKDDTLAFCAADSNGQLHIRFDDIEHLATSKMQSDGTPLTDLAVSSISQCNILPIASIPSDIPRNAQRKSRGISVATAKGQRMRELMKIE